MGGAQPNASGVPHPSTALRAGSKQTRLGWGTLNTGDGLVGWATRPHEALRSDPRRTSLTGDKLRVRSGALTLSALMARCSAVGIDRETCSYRVSIVDGGHLMGREQF